MIIKNLQNCSDEEIISEYYCVKRVLSEDDRANPMSYSKYISFKNYYDAIVNTINKRQIGGVV